MDGCDYSISHFFHLHSRIGQPQFQNSQAFALDGGVMFDTLANSYESHAAAEMEC